MTNQPQYTALVPVRRRRRLGTTLLVAGFVAALFPVFHWSLGTAASAMTYLLGTAALITAGTVAVYMAGRTPGTETEGAGE